MARRLAQRGWSLVIDARRSDRLADAVRELRAYTNVAGVTGDVSDPAHRQALAEAAWALGPVRLLVNNASTLGASPLPALGLVDPDVVRRTYEVNVVAPLALYQQFRRTLERGTIVNITSDAAAGAYEGWGVYGSSKAALEQWSRVLAAEESELRVLVFDPGDMQTEMHQDAFPGEDITDRPPPDASADAIVSLIEGPYASGRYDTATLVVK